MNVTISHTAGAREEDHPRLAEFTVGEQSVQEIVSARLNFIYHLPTSNTVSLSNEKAIALMTGVGATRTCSDELPKGNENPVGCGRSK